MANKTEEIWRDIRGYEGKYQISSFGRCKSVKRLVRAGQGGNGFRSVAEKILKVRPNRKGYCYYSLSVQQRVINHGAHTLVATHFLDNPHKYKDVNHIDEDKSNNNLSNLEWSNRRANVNYSANKKSTSKYPGVYQRKKGDGKFEVGCTIKDKKYYLGRFIKEEDAAQAYIDFCKDNNLTYDINECRK